MPRARPAVDGEGLNPTENSRYLPLQTVFESIFTHGTAEGHASAISGPPLEILNRSSQYLNIYPVNDQSRPGPGFEGVLTVGEPP